MPDLLKALLVSASLGALLGLERQWSGQRENPASDTLAGARTFALWAALGTLCAWFAEQPPSRVFPRRLRRHECLSRPVSLPAGRPRS